MCHIASSLAVHSALSSLFFFPLPLTIPFPSLYYLDFLYFSSYKHHYLLYHLNFFLIHHSDPPITTTITAPTSKPNALFLFKCFIFTHILPQSTPMTLCHSRQNYYSWIEHRLSGAVLCSLGIIHLWSIPFCGEPSSYRPVMIGVLATLCICTVI